MCFWAKMPSGICELSCALISNVYAICKYCGKPWGVGLSVQRLTQKQGGFIPQKQL